MPAIAYPNFVAELLKLYGPPFRAKATRTKMAQVLAEFGRLPGVRRTSDLTPGRIADWILAHPARRPVTAHSLLRSLRAAAGYARSQGYLRADPFQWRSPAKWLGLDDGDSGHAEFGRHRTAAVVGRVLALLDREAAGGSWEAGRLQALVYLYAFAGMRKQEALGLRVADFDLPGRLVFLRSHPRRTLKTPGSAAPLGIADRPAEVLSRWLPRTGCAWAFPGTTRSGPWTGGPPGRKPLDQVRAAGARAGVEGLTILDFRHTIGAMAEGWGLGELELQRWLRHTRRRTQDYYRRAGDLEAIRATAAKIRYGSAG